MKLSELLPEMKAEWLASGASLFDLMLNWEVTAKG